MVLDAGASSAQGGLLSSSQYVLVDIGVNIQIVHIMLARCVKSYACRSLSSRNKDDKRLPTSHTEIVQTAGLWPQAGRGRADVDPPPRRNKLRALVRSCFPDINTTSTTSSSKMSRYPPGDPRLWTNFPPNHNNQLIMPPSAYNDENDPEFVRARDSADRAEAIAAQRYVSCDPFS